MIIETALRALSGAKKGEKTSVSTEYWGVVMYGVTESELKFKPIEELLKLDEVKDFAKDNEFCMDDIGNLIDDEVFGGCSEISTKIPNGKYVSIINKYIQNDGYVYGLHAGYPWSIHLQGITKDDVHDALWQLLGKYLDMTKDELANKCEEINTYNWG